MGSEGWRLEALRLRTRWSGLDWLIGYWMMKTPLEALLEQPAQLLEKLLAVRLPAVEVVAELLPGLLVGLLVGLLLLLVELLLGLLLLQGLLLLVELLLVEQLVGLLIELVVEQLVGLLLLLLGLLLVALLVGLLLVDIVEVLVQSSQGVEHAWLLVAGPREQPTEPHELPPVVALHARCAVVPEQPVVAVVEPVEQHVAVAEPA